MRVANWRGKEIFNQIAELALQNANSFMDDVKNLAKQICPVDTVTVRPPGWQTATVDFYHVTYRGAYTNPKTKKYNAPLIKVRHVYFTTDKRWTGRKPGDLQRTLRRVNRQGKPENMRVYAGNFKIYYAHFVERGTVRTKAQPFLRPAFERLKPQVIDRIKNG